MQRALPRHFTAYSVTVVFYVGIIAFLYYFQTIKPIKSNALIKEQEHKIEMVLSTFVPEVIPPIVVKKIETPKKVVPTKVIATKVVKKIIPKKVILKKVIIKKPKPIVKKKVIKKKIVKKSKPKIIKKVATPKGKVATKMLQKQNKNQKPQASSAEKKHFLSKVRRKIEKNKYYPRIAKKRGMEGIVKVRFRILSNGNVSDISVSGPKVFHTSAKEAVNNAFPISIKHMPLSLLEDYVTIPLNYKIR